MADCPACTNWAGAPTGECKACNGTGKEGTVFTSDCRKCGGTGNCTRCDGTGQV